MARRGGGPDDGKRLMPRQLGDHPDDLGTGAREGEHSGEADVLGADHERPPADALAAKLDHLLEHARGQDASRTRPGHQASSAISRNDSCCRAWTQSWRSAAWKANAKCHV